MAVHVQRDECEDFIPIDEAGEAADPYHVHAGGAGDVYGSLAPFGWQRESGDVSRLQEAEEDSDHRADEERFALPRPVLPPVVLHGLPVRRVQHTHPFPMPVRAELGQAYPNGGFGGVPATDAAIADLEKRKYDGSREDEGCVICTQDYEVGDEISVMPCSQRHAFHRSCLARWLALSRLCPLCRHALLTK